MEALFLKVLNMSVTAGYVILVILLLRLLLRKAPKRYSYLLWAVAAFRLCCPVSFQSVFSLFNLKPFDMTAAQKSGGAALQYIPANVGKVAQPEISTGLPFVNMAVNPVLPAATPAQSVNPMQLIITIGTWVWLAGVAGLLVYGVVTYLRLCFRMRDAVLFEENVRQSDKVRSPFILGFFRPRIFIPFGLDESTRRYVLAHEACHIRRGDHLIKPLAYLVLVLHWFNPLVWLAFYRMGSDMEMSCDERVLSSESGIKKEYGMTLLSFASNRRFPSPSPLAFGETGVKGRIKNVLNYRKPAFWIVLASIVVCVAAAVCLLSNPKSADKGEVSGVNQPGITALPENPDSTQMLTLGNDTFYPSYLSSSCLYMIPLSSYAPFGGDSGCQYLVSEDSFSIVTRSNGETQTISPVEWGWQEFPYTDEEWKNLFSPADFDSLSILSPYTERLYQPLDDRNCLFRMDGELWLVRFFQNDKLGPRIWSIYTLVPEDSPSENKGASVQTGNPFLWMNIRGNSNFSQDDSKEITLPEFPEVTFRWRSKGVEAIANGKAATLYAGSPVWNLYFCDLTGDGLPELCSETSYGSGIVDDRITVYDYAEGKVYDLNDRGFYDYNLELKNGRLYLLQYRYPKNILEGPIASGLLELNGSSLKMNQTGVENALGYTNLEDALHAAITEHHQGRYLEGDFACEGHVIFDLVDIEDPYLPKKTAYALAIYREYIQEDGKVKNISGASIPTVLTFDYTASGAIVLQEYWEPRDGSYYDTDLKEKYPAEIYEKLQNSQPYIDDMEAECEEKAKEYLKHIEK